MLTRAQFALGREKAATTPLPLPSSSDRARAAAVFLVVFGLVSLVLGMKGNEWAWHDKKWESVEHFRRTQRSWAMWGLIITGAFLVIGLVLGATGILKLQ